MVARQAPVAVVFRRGPTRQVELLSWDLQTDELTPGQWLKGRIYERRCDLSPSGRLLIYFAGKYETPLRTWTAISRPPYLTALALWPKRDAWGGGGLFDDERRIRLNHRPAEMALDDDFTLPPGLTVRALGEGSGWGEDDPIHHYRLVRDGWTMVDEESVQRGHGIRRKYGVTFEPPIRYRRRIGTRAAVLEMSIEALDERQGSWYVTSYRLVRDRGTREMGRADWIDAAPDGDLLIARGGRLYRLSPADFDAPEASLREVADLRAHRFEQRQAPGDALNWPESGHERDAATADGLAQPSPGQPPPTPPPVAVATLGEPDDGLPANPLELRVEELGLSRAVQRALVRHDIRKAGQLVQLQEDDLVRMSGVGPAGARQIARRLREAGIGE